MQWGDRESQAEGDWLDAVCALSLTLSRSSSHSHLPSFITFCNPLSVMGANLSKALGASSSPSDPREAAVVRRCVSDCLLTRVLLRHNREDFWEQGDEVADVGA